MSKMRRVKVFNVDALGQRTFGSEGDFHEWGVTSRSSPENYGSFTLAIVENDNGEIITVEPDCIEFIDKPKDDSDPKTINMS